MARLGAGRDFPLAWLSLDEDDYNPARILGTFALALENVRPGLGESALALLHTPGPPAGRVVLAGLLDDQAALDELFVFVLDDYHIVTAPPIRQAMEIVLDGFASMPAPMRLVILTRPPCSSVGLAHPACRAPMLAAQPAPGEFGRGDIELMFQRPTRLRRPLPPARRSARR